MGLINDDGALGNRSTHTHRYVMVYHLSAQPHQVCIQNSVNDKNNIFYPKQKNFIGI